MTKMRWDKVRAYRASDPSWSDLCYEAEERHLERLALLAEQRDWARGVLTLAGSTAPLRLGDVERLVSVGPACRRGRLRAGPTTELERLAGRFNLGMHHLHAALRWHDLPPE